MFARCFVFTLAALALNAASFTHRAHAQINAESLAESVEGPGFGGAAKASLSFFKGNVDLLEVLGETATRYATKHPDASELETFAFRDRVLVYGTAGLKNVSGAEVANNGYGHLRYTRMQWVRFGGEVFVQAQYDRQRLLTRRMVYGGGMRAVLLSRNDLSAWVGSGYMYEAELRKIPSEDKPPLGPDPSRMVNHRWNNYLTFTFDVLQDVLDVTNVVYVQPRFDDMADIQILEQLSLIFKLTERLSFNSDLYVRYDSRAPRSVKKTDIRLSQGLSVSF